MESEHVYHDYCGERRRCHSSIMYCIKVRHVDCCASCSLANLCDFIDYIMRIHLVLVETVSAATSDGLKQSRMFTQGTSVVAFVYGTSCRHQMPFNSALALQKLRTSMSIHLNWYGASKADHVSLELQYRL